VLPPDDTFVNARNAVLPRKEFLSLEDTRRVLNVEPDLEARAMTLRALAPVLWDRSGWAASKLVRDVPALERLAFAHTAFGPFYLTANVAHKIICELPEQDRVVLAMGIRIFEGDRYPTGLSKIIVETAPAHRMRYLTGIRPPRVFTALEIAFICRNLPLEAERREFRPQQRMARGMSSRRAVLC